MVQTPSKTSITKGYGNKKAVKYSVSYVRVSSAKQTKDEKSGLRRQERDYVRWLQKHQEYRNLDGLEIRDLGVSGRKNVKQGALGLFIKKAEKGEIPANTCLVVESMSRLTREQPYDGIKLLMRIWDLGHNIAFTQGSWGGDILNGRESGIFSRVSSALEAASYEWEDKQARINEYHTDVYQRLEEGDLSHYVSRKGKRGRMYPFWLDFDDKTNKFMLLEEKVKLVQRIFNMAETMGAKKIYYILKKEGIKNITNGNATDLTVQSIREIIKNRAVLGETTKRGTKFHPFPVIITPEQFTAVQSATKLRTTFSGNPTANNKLVNLFQGILFCGACGGRIDVVNKKRDACVNKGEKNGLKKEVSYRQMFCHHGRNKTSDCTVQNAIPYVYEHSGLDNELNILKKIQTFRWAEYFTDEKHEEELKVEIDKRNLFLEERNKFKDQIAKHDRAADRYFDEGEILPKNLREKRKEAQENYEKLDEKYNRSVLDIQNLKRKKTGLQAEKDIKTRVQEFIKKGRFDANTRSEFNMWIKEQGIAVQVQIGEKLKKYPNNYRLDVGLGMYDSKNKYIGLDQRAEDAYVLGVDVKEVIKEQIAEKNRPIKVGKTTVTTVTT
jgi:hypothetical protein